MFAHVVLVLFSTCCCRAAACCGQGRQATVAQFRQNLNEPEDSLFVTTTSKNQFELPIFFHVGCIAI